MTGFESGKVFKSLQKCTFRIAKKQEQFRKLYHKILSKWQMTGMESGKVFKHLQKCTIRIAKKQEQFRNLIQNVIKKACD